MSGPNGEPNISIDDGIINDEDEFGEEEYVAINSMLDQINSYLDDLEERNDALNGKLHELMESNRQARLEFRAQLLGSEEQQQQQQQEEKHPADEEKHPADEEKHPADEVTSSNKKDVNEDGGSSGGGGGSSQQKMD